jgi:hypothetical protein
MVIRNCNPSTWEVVARGFQVQDQAGLHDIVTPCLKKKKKKERKKRKEKESKTTWFNK